MSKKKKEKGLDSLTKTEKSQAQQILRTDAEARAEYIKEVVEAVQNNLTYVREEAESNRYERSKVIKFIDTWPDQLGNELLFVLDLITGDDINAMSRKQKHPDEKWGISKRLDILDL